MCNTFSRSSNALRALRKTPWLVVWAVAVTFIPSSSVADFDVGVVLGFGTGDGPTDVAIGDLNGDEAADLVVVNCYSSTVSVLLGSGGGTFGLRTDFATGSEPFAVAIGDVNGDGRLDIAVANRESDTVSVLLGNGAGGFGLKTDFLTGDYPIDLAIMDFNDDEAPDLVVANHNSNTLSVLFGDGSGGFGDRADFAAGALPISVTAGDVNQDGWPDLAVANSGSNTVSVLPGECGGTFGIRTEFATGSDPRSVAIGDVNGDGRPDLAVANFGSNTASVLLGNGEGGFEPKTDFAASGGPVSVAIVDADGDSRADLAMANPGSNAVSVLLGDGVGGFGLRTDFATGSDPYSVAVGDMNGDGWPDLAVANRVDNSISVMLGRGSGGFGAKTEFVTGDWSQSFVIADLNRDGNLDLAVANYASHTVAVLLGDGAGSFGARRDFTTGFVPQFVEVGDLSGDGWLDLVVASMELSTVSVLLGDGAGGFGAKTDYPTGAFPFDVAIGDLNGDSVPDLATANAGSPSGAFGSVSVLLGSGAGGFGTKTDFMTGDWASSVAIGDLDEDGWLDLAVTNALSNTVSVLLGNGAGGFGAKTDFTTGTYPWSVAIGDVSGDGLLDLAVANSRSHTVSVLLGSGAGGFAAKTDFPAGTFCGSIAIGDLNGDGLSDLTTANMSTPGLSVLLGNGAGSFGTKMDYDTGPNGPISVAIGDVNGDGRLDLAVSCPAPVASTVSVLLALEKTRTIMSSNPNPVVLGASLTFGANVSGFDWGSESPTGTVSFYDGNTLCGTVPVQPIATTLTIPASRLGLRTLSAVYSGDGRFSGSISAAHTQRVVAPAVANLQGPSTLAAAAGTSSPPVYGQVFIDCTTSEPGATPDLVTYFGYGPDGSDPNAGGWHWRSADFNRDVDNNDEYVGTLMIYHGPGTYDYCFRYSYGGGEWTYGDLDGSANGYSPSQAGAMTVFGVGWANLQGPATIDAALGCATAPIYGRVRVEGLSAQTGATPNLVAQVGYGPDGSDPGSLPSTWQWTAAAFSADVDGNDEYVASLNVPTAGLYDYCFRYSYGGGTWHYGDLDGNLVNGYLPSQAGSLTIAGVEWANLQGPSTQNPAFGYGTGSIYGSVQFFPAPAVPGATSGLVAELGYGPDGSTPESTFWQWTAATFNADVGDQDQFVGWLRLILPPTTWSATYDYCFRYAFGGGPWTYGDLDGSANGYSPTQAGSLTIAQDSPVVPWGSDVSDLNVVPAPNGGFIRIAGGWEHSLALRGDGLLRAWGLNDDGQCNAPAGSYAAIAAGGYHSLGLKTDGTIWCWGRNGDNQCTVPAPNSGFVALGSGKNHSLGVKAGGAIVAWGDNDAGQCTVPSPNTGFVAVAGGRLHSLGLKVDGSIVAWGSNNRQQCNVPAPNTGFVAIAAGDEHSLGLKSDGTIVAWGSNTRQQCDVPAPNSGFVAIAAGYQHSLGMKSDGTVVAWGLNNKQQCEIPAPNGGFIAIAAGGEHSLGMTRNVSAVPDEVVPPATEVVLQCQPNPFNPQTTFSYSQPTAGNVRLAIYDVRGALIAMLVDGDQPAGGRTVQWNGTNANGVAVPSGVYFARMATASEVRTIKVTLAK